nr:hypothetical protein [Tanacetum cinerariifolium]
MPHQTTAVKNALADRRASINLMPYYLFRKLGISKLKPTKMSIQLADHSLKYPIGVCENLLVKINKFIFPVDFVVLEIDKDESVPIILGCPFLVMARTVIDTIKFVHDQQKDTVHLDGKWVETDQNHEKPQAVSLHPRHEVEPLKWRAPNNHLKPSIKEPPKLELKELYEHLEYSFLQGDDQLTVVVSSYLSKYEKYKLLN